MSFTSKESFLRLDKNIEVRLLLQLNTVEFTISKVFCHPCNEHRSYN